MSTNPSPATTWFRKSSIWLTLWALALGVAYAIACIPVEASDAYDVFPSAVCATVLLAAAIDSLLRVLARRVNDGPTRREA